MSKELIRTRCSQGTLIITDEYIATQLPGQLQQRILYRSVLTGVDSRIAAFPIFGLGGGMNFTFHGGAETLHADMVKWSVAQEILALFRVPPPPRYCPCSASL